MLHQNSANVLGVNVACVDVPGILEQVNCWSRQTELRTILYVNAHCFNLACDDPLYHHLLTCADLVYSDGISVVWAGRWLGNSQLCKITGADWIYNFCQLAELQGLRIYILAGRPGIAENARHNLLEKYPALEIVGVCDGYFQHKSPAQVLEEIALALPHVVFVGLGTPRQEKWIAEQRAVIRAPVCWAVGAMFDYVAGVEPRAPGWVNALALEWLWRLCMDPIGKWRRYILGNPLFVYRILRQKLSHHLSLPASFS